MASSSQLKARVSRQDFPGSKMTYRLDFTFSRDVLAVVKAARSALGNNEPRWVGSAWRFRNIRTALMLQEFGFDLDFDNVSGLDMLRFNREYTARIALKEELKSMKGRMSTDFVPNGINGEMYPFQRADAEFIVRSGGRCMNLSEAGAGKSLVTLAALTHMGDRKILIACPSTARYSWEDEVNKWTNLTPAVIDSDNRFTAEMFAGADVIIATYSRVAMDIDVFRGMGFDALVGDESHNSKGSASARGKAMVELASVIPHVIVMTGTVLRNRPTDLWVPLSMVEPGEWGTSHSFGIRYAGGRKGRFGWEFNKATNVDDLRRRMEPLFVRRLKRDVLPFLPPVRETVRNVIIGSGDMEKYREMERDRLLSKKGGSMSLTDASAAFCEMRQLLSASKLPEAMSIIDSVMAAGEKLLVFSVYNAPLERLKEYYGKSAVMVIGKVTDKKRREAKDMFLDDPDVRLFLGGMGSAGEALTLTSSRTVVFIDYSWIPAEHEQAKNRVNRPGQKADEVRVIQLNCPGTLDDHAKDIQAMKDGFVDDIFGDSDEEKSESTVKELARRYGFRIKGEKKKEKFDDSTKKE